MQNQTFNQAMSRLLKGVERESGGTMRQVIVAMLVCAAMATLLLDVVAPGDGLLRNLVRGLGWFYLAAMSVLTICAAIHLMKQPEPGPFDRLD